MKSESESRSVVSDSLWHHGLLQSVSSVFQSCLTLLNHMDHSTPGLSVHHQLPEFTQTHLHWVGNAIQPSYPLLSLSPPAFNLSQHQGLFNWVSSSHQVAKVLEFQPHHQSFQWTLRILWNSPGQDTGVGSLSLLQGIFPTQGSNLGLLHCRQILYQLNHQGSPRILECVAYPFSSGFSQPRNRTGVSCIAGGFFTNWAMMEA